jgi:hypothetical protein
MTLEQPDTQLPQRLVWGAILTVVTAASTLAVACGTRNSRCSILATTRRSGSDRGQLACESSHWFWVAPLPVKLGLLSRRHRSGNRRRAIHDCRHVCASGTGRDGDCAESYRLICRCVRHLRGSSFRDQPARQRCGFRGARGSIYLLCECHCICRIAAAQDGGGRTGVYVSLRPSPGAPRIS